MKENFRGVPPEELSRTHQLWTRSLLEALPDAAWLEDLQGRLLACNSRFENLCGHPESEMAGAEVQTFLGLSVSDSSGERETRYASDGHVEYLEFIRRPLKDPFEDREGFLVTCRDVSERHEAQNLFRSAFYTNPDAINITTFDGRFVEVNEGFIRATGFSRDEVLSHKISPVDLWSKPEERQRYIETIQKAGEVSNFEAWFVRKDKNPILGLISAKIIKLGGRPLLLSVTRDITLLRQSEIALAKAQRLESIGVMAGGIAHDFNNLLSAILGSIDLARLNHQDPAHVEAHLAVAMSAVSRASDLTHQLLSFAKAGQADKRPLDLGKLLEESCDLAFTGSKVEVRLDIEPHLPRLMADESKLLQVFSNLLINARQANDNAGCVEVSARLAASGEATSSLRRLVVRVKDQGPGIPAENFQKIFDPFFTTKAQGTGLGLAVAQRIVQEHKGTLTAANLLEGGCCFELSLPLFPEDPTS
ncbi:MAG: PAS domain S-box protein [Spirochaetales bacterium]|nr:PAS domain S-box protein [Spirochaetales bacterium]